jgi:hypothetical protein
VPIAGERCKEDGTGVKRNDAGGGRRKKRRVEKNERVGYENVRKCQRSAEVRLNLEDAGMCRPQKTSESCKERLEAGANTAPDIT